ncbi:stage II sporulation protein M [Thalassobacillus pellis]|uniref:stage II sporulation protein M n=1 Tax=Thalassobacillus pellis TaxID=748008 RepID=UPI001961660B|nr:stage II sporulation protein M [Thalassobacillus pellis]MBM7552388.1 stage II sporulation protein M [Thalassobacillus pellis]
MYLQQRLLKNHFTSYINIYVFISVLFLIGIIFGAIIVNSMNFIQKQDLYFYLNQFFKQTIDTNSISQPMLFWDSLSYHLKYMLLIFILGISVIGMPVITVLLFIKGLVVGFSVGFLVNQMGWYGLFISSVSIAPQNLLVIPVYLIAGAIAMIFSITLFKQLFSKRMHQPVMKVFMQYGVLFLLLFACLVIAAFIEAFLSSQAMEMVVKWIYSQ